MSRDPVSRLQLPPDLVTYKRSEEILPFLENLRIYRVDTCNSTLIGCGGDNEISKLRGATKALIIHVATLVFCL